MKPKTLELNPDQLEKSGIPRRFWESGLDEVYIQADSLKRLNMYVTRFSMYRRNSVGLFIAGIEQVGKTKLANIVLKSMLTRKIKCLYVRADDLVNAHFNREKDTDGLSLDDYLSADLLALDDIAANGNAGYPIAVSNLLRARFNGQKPTILCFTVQNEVDAMSAFEQDYGRELTQMVRNHFLTIRLEYNEAFVGHPDTTDAEHAG